VKVPVELLLNEKVNEPMRVATRLEPGWKNGTPVSTNTSP
jgi:hypothetical protein